MSDPTQKKLEAKSVGYKIGVAESERSLSNLGEGREVGEDIRPRAGSTEFGDAVFKSLFQNEARKLLAT